VWQKSEIKMKRKSIFITVPFKDEEHYVENIVLFDDEDNFIDIEDQFQHDQEVLKDPLYLDILAMETSILCINLKQYVKRNLYQDLMEYNENFRGEK
jgi:hypothetical protein